MDAAKSGGWKCPYPVLVAENTPVTVNRIERVLGSMIVAVLGFSVLIMVIVLIAGASGVDFSEGVWPFFAKVPQIGLPIGFLLLVALIVTVGVRRARASRDAA